MKRLVAISMIAILAGMTLSSQTAYDLGQALSLGLVRLALHGNGGSSGLAAEGQVESISGTVVYIRCAMPAVKLANSGTGQDMALVALIPADGLAVEIGGQLAFKVAPRERKQVDGLAFCLKLEADNPTSSESFAFGGALQDTVLSSIFRKFVALAFSTQIDGGLVEAFQVATWLRVNGDSAATCLKIKSCFSSDPEVFSKARELLAGAS